MAQNTATDDLDSQVNIIEVSIPLELDLKNILSVPFRLIHFNNFSKKLATNKPDIIHITNLHPWIAMGMPFLKKQNVVATIHEPCQVPIF